jgi:hypothetical protein
MANYKKNVREINKAKNFFIKWLKDNNAECLEYDKPEVSEEWNYHCVVSGFLGDNLYMVYFMVWEGMVDILYGDGENYYTQLSVSEFMELIN